MDRRDAILIFLWNKLDKRFDELKADFRNI